MARPPFTLPNTIKHGLFELYLHGIPNRMKFKARDILFFILSAAWICCIHTATTCHVHIPSDKGSYGYVADNTQTVPVSRFTDITILPESGITYSGGTDVPLKTLDRSQRPAKVTFTRQKNLPAGNSTTQAHHSVYNLSNKSFIAGRPAKDHYILALRQLII